MYAWDKFHNIDIQDDKKDWDDMKDWEDDYEDDYWEDDYDSYWEEDDEWDSDDWESDDDVCLFGTCKDVGEKETDCEW